MASSHLSSELLARVEEAFHHALLLEESERDSFFSQIDAEVAELARSLVAADLEYPSSSDEPMIGPYRITRSLGRGGTARVVLATRDDGEFHQIVAVKILDAPFRSEYLAERFRQEREILNALNHPNIARLFDWGISAQGSFYIVMEYVDGTALDSYVKEAQLNRGETLRLFRTVAEAVQAAHRGSIVHRDLKPANILVTATGVVKLLDFGTAKLEIKAHGGQTDYRFRAFTPEYASPEQVAGRALTTATDIYSLGVILYRMLTGRAPYEVDDLNNAQLLEVVVNRPHAPPELDADLNAIIDKALRKDPVARHGSVEELIRDLDCYLEGRPVPARRGGKWYRARRFARRNRISLTFLAVILLLAITGTGAVLWQARIAQSRDADLRNLTSSLLEEIYARVGELPGSRQTQEALVNRALLQLDKFARQSQSDAWVRRQLAGAYLKTGNLQGSPYEQNLGEVEAGLASIQKALRLIESVLAETPGDVEAMRLKASALSSNAGLQLISGHGDMAVRDSRTAASLYDQLDQPRTSRGDLASATAWTSYGDMLGQVGVSSVSDFAQAMQAYQHAEQLIASTEAGRSDGKAMRALAVVNIKVADLIRERDPVNAERRYEKTLTILDGLSEQGALPVQRTRLMAETKLATDLAELKNSKAEIHGLRALELAQSLVTISPDDQRALLDLAVAEVNLAEVYFDFGRYSEAARFYSGVCQTGRNLLKKNPASNLYLRVVSEGSLMRDLSCGLSGQTTALPKLSSELDGIIRFTSKPQATISDVRLALGILTQPALPIERRPKVAVALAERAVQQTRRLSPALLWQLASAYDSDGNRVQSKLIAEEGLRLLSSDQSRLRSRLQELAQVHQK